MGRNKGIKGTVYDRRSGRQILHYSKKEKAEITALAKKGKQALKDSDLLNNHNLLRFYTPLGFVPDDPNRYDYANNYQRMLQITKMLGSNSTSLYSQKHKSTTNLYKTDAIQLQNRQKEITQVPASAFANN